MELCSTHQWRQVTCQIFRLHEVLASQEKDGARRLAEAAERSANNLIKFRGQLGTDGAIRTSKSISTVA